MNGEFLAVGTELLLGDILNTNAQYLSRELSALGINLFYQSVCGDNPGRLSACLDVALARCDLLVMTGGLGPTYDDLTKETVAAKLGVPLELHQPSLQRIEAFFEKIGRPMTDNNRKQAMMPKGATIFPNDWGTAPACALEQNGKIVIMLPGPPREMKPLFDNCVVPFLQKFAGQPIVSQNVRVYGMGESAVEDVLKTLMTQSKNPTVAPYAKDGEVCLRVTARAETVEMAQKMIRPVIDEIKNTLGDVVYGVGVDSLQEAAVAELFKQGLTVATAESCTAGLLSKRITEIPGASEVFHCGIVSYANEIKEQLLQVSQETLAKYGAVSPQVAQEMAQGVRKLAKADLGVGITGIAGPGGGSAEKPVGLVYVAVCNGAETRIKELRIGRGGGNERELVRYNATSCGLDMVRRLASEMGAAV